jgi:hypothetical protein
MSWQPPSKRSTLLDDIPQSSSFKKDPLAIDYQGSLKQGESYVMRILSFAQGEATETPARKCYRAFKDKDGNVKGYKDRVVADPGHPANQSIQDDNGVKLSDCDVAKIFRTPSILLYKCDKENNVVEEINELRYVEYTAGIAKQLKELQDDIEDGLGFEAIPDYDIRLKIVDNNGIKNYEIKPVRKIKTDSGTVNCDRFGKPLAEAVGDEFMEYLGENMPGMIEHLAQLQADEMNPDNVKKNFLRYQDEKGSNAGGNSGGGTRPNMPPKPSRRNDGEDEGSNEPESKPEASEPIAAPGRFPKIKPKS